VYVKDLQSQSREEGFQEKEKEGLKGYAKKLMVASSPFASFLLRFLPSLFRLF
jgi:hypothetical protein